MTVELAFGFFSFYTQLPLALTVGLAIEFFFSCYTVSLSHEFRTSHWIFLV